MAQQEATAALIDSLNGDLAYELQAVAQYIQYSAMATGPARLQVAELFREEITDELGHAQFLAEKVAALGGVPATEAPAVPQASGVREMLEEVRDAEADAIQRYTERVAEAEEAGEIGLKVQLEEMIQDETRHKEEVEKILAGWSQEPAPAS